MDTFAYLKECKKSNDSKNSKISLYQLNIEKDNFETSGGGFTSGGGTLGNKSDNYSGDGKDSGKD